MSAEEARAMGMLVADATASRSTATSSSHDAKQTALGLARAGYRPPRRRTFRLPGDVAATRPCARRCR